MEKLYMKFREKLQNGDILNPDSPNLWRCMEEAEILGYENYNCGPSGTGLFSMDEEGYYYTFHDNENKIISEGYKEHFLTPQYREVYVSDVSVEFALENKEKRVLITELPGKAEFKYICVAEEREEFKISEEYIDSHWKYIAEIPKEELEKEMTLSEVEKELGYPIKIIK